jgi:RimJ/RimL family protein N-acetyltransferase
MSPVETGRLILEPITLAHASELYAVLRDAALHRYTGGEPPTFEELQQRLARWAAGSSDASEEWLNWVIRIRSTGTVAGYVQATVFSDGSAAIAYVVGSEYQHRGIATEATRVVVETLSERGGIARIVAYIHPDHVASQRVAQRVGLERTDRVEDDGEEVWALDVAIHPDVGETPKL